MNIKNSRSSRWTEIFPVPSGGRVAISVENCLGKIGDSQGVERIVTDALGLGIEGIVLILDLVQDLSIYQLRQQSIVKKLEVTGRSDAAIQVEINIVVDGGTYPMHEIVRRNCERYLFLLLKNDKIFKGTVCKVCLRFSLFCHFLGKNIGEEATGGDCEQK